MNAQCAQSRDQADLRCTITLKKLIKLTLDSHIKSKQEILENILIHNNSIESTYGTFCYEKGLL